MSQVNEGRINKHATDDDFFRAARWLLPGVPTDDDGAVVASRELWPLLFELWERTVKRPAATQNGPTHRFITFVHRVVGLPDPSASTIRDAIKEWRNGNRWSMSAGPPPWRRPGKD
jgi:hypothetical protein